MGAPLILVSAVANSKLGRRIALTAITLALALALALCTGFLVVMPLVAVPLALAAHGTIPVEKPDGALPVANGQWGYPLAGEYTKGRGYGYNPVEGCSYCSTNHKGYDMAQGCGSTIYAAGPGTVTIAGSYSGWGNSVLIDHGQGLETLYGHMQWDSLRVRVGDTVTAGTPVGAEGNTGQSFGCHLHFEIRVNGTAIDPQPFMAERGLPLK